MALACTSDAGVDGDGATSPESATVAPPSSSTAPADASTTAAEAVSTTSSTAAASSTTTTPSAVATTLAVTTTTPDATTEAGDPVATSQSTSTTVPPATTSSTAAASSTTTTLADDLTVVEVTLRDGRAVGGDRVEVPLGNRISLRFDSDTRVVVHIHGYDEEFSVEAGVPTVHEFVGDLPGIFEVEDHVTHRLLIELKVSP